MSKNRTFTLIFMNFYCRYGRTISHVRIHVRRRDSQPWDKNWVSIGSKTYPLKPGCVNSSSSTVWAPTFFFGVYRFPGGSLRIIYSLGRTTLLWSMPSAPKLSPQVFQVTIDKLFVCEFELAEVVWHCCKWRFLRGMFSSQEAFCWSTSCTPFQKWLWATKWKCTARRTIAMEILSEEVGKPFGDSSLPTDVQLNGKGFDLITFFPRKLTCTPKQCCFCPFKLRQYLYLWIMGTNSHLLCYHVELCVSPGVGSLFVQSPFDP